MFLVSLLIYTRLDILKSHNPTPRQRPNIHPMEVKEVVLSMPLWNGITILHLPWVPLKIPSCCSSILLFVHLNGPLFDTVWLLVICYIPKTTKNVIYCSKYIILSHLHNIFFLWNTGLVTLLSPHPLTLKTFWKFFAELVLARKQSLYPQKIGSTIL